ncbi:hypothetical protein BGZ98_006985 [Dissophora globulifera]|nr:hypothetical protein BGZ98_006985 [Dissophora globulifera]
MSNVGTPSTESPPAANLLQETPGATTTDSAAPASPATVMANLRRRGANTKVVVRFKGVGGVPVMKNNLFKITGNRKFSAVIQFLRKEINYKNSDPLVFYVNSAFSPAPDEIVGDLFQCFGTDGTLIVNYSVEPAWG